MDSENSLLVPLDILVLTEYPYPIAVNYRRVLDANDWPTKVELALKVFEYGLRAITLGVISQYLIRDAHQVSDPALNNLLLRKLPQATLGSWKQMLFDALKAYGGKRDLFFMKELYDLYWDSSYTPQRQRSGVQHPYDRLIQIRNDLAHRPKPTRENDWRAIGEEVMTLLREVLAQFAFIQNYDLVRIFERRGNSYTCAIYTGESIVTPSAPLHSDKELQQGWFYLSKDNREYLQLHPLLIFWEDPSVSTILAESLKDAAIYERFTKDNVIYIATVLQRIVEDRSLIGEFVRILYYNIEKIKQHRRDARKLTWWLLQDVAHAIIEQRFGDMRSKYRKDLYLQRNEVKKVFDNFLASEHTAFLLLGKSGVGKSNFLLSLLDEYEAKDKIVILLYNGAKLETDKSLTETIGRDLESHLQLVGETGEREIKDVLLEISRIENIEQCQVVLIIDAVNENANAKSLLQRINSLVEASTYSWLKVVFSSRPEAWRAMKRGIKLSEHRYYRASQYGDIGAELQTFSFAVELKHFAREELPLVYENYRRAYELQTTYEELAFEMRRLLSDPLTLRLIAQTYRRKSIPSELRPGEIYQLYVEQLIADERLQVADIKFLEEDLMPLMIAEDHFAKSISAQEINSAVTTSRRLLFELIHSDEFLSNGQRVNQSFVNLADAEILVLLGSAIDYELGFKYERFYDYYAGRRIYRLSQNKKDQHAFSLEMIRRTIEKPFLWGGVKSALVQKAKEYGSEIVKQLCFTDQQRVKEMMVGVLDDIGRDNPSHAEAIIRSLIPSETRVTGFQKVWRLFREPRAVTDISARNAWKIAIETASNLNIPWVLWSSASQPDPTIRTVAVRHSYHLWQRDPRAGFEILELLAHKLTSGMIPDVVALESVLGLSLIIFFDHPRDNQILGRLQSVWRDIISRFLGVREKSSLWGNAFRTFVREVLFSFVSTIAFRLFREFPQYNVVNYEDLNAFFRLGNLEKSLYRRLIQYLDVKEGYSAEQIENDFLAVLGIRNMHIESVAIMVLVAHITHSPQIFLPFLKKFFEEAQKDPLPSPYLSDVPNILTAILNRDPMADEVFNFFVYTVEASQKYYSKHRHIPGYNRDKVYHYATPAMYLGPYILYQYQRTGTVKTDWLESRVRDALAEKAVPFFEVLLKQELPLVGIELRTPRAALDALGLFFTIEDSEIGEMIQAFLARLHLYYPDEVDDFLDEQDTPDHFRLWVRTNEPFETVGGLIGIRTWQFLRDDVILGSSALRSLLMRVFAKAADCKDLRAWINYIIREVVNLIYGEEVLRHSK